MTTTVTASIDVEAPIRAVYNQWTQFEEFPKFMSSVERIRQLDDTTTRWEVSVGGVRREFDAKITDQVPDDHISWVSQDETVHAGTVRFAPTPDGGTRVDLEMSWEPESFAERVGAKLNLDETAAKRDLERFREFIEERQEETGVWRGEVHGGTPTP